MNTEKYLTPLHNNTRGIGSVSHLHLSFFNSRESYNEEDDRISLSTSIITSIAAKSKHALLYSSFHKSIMQVITCIFSYKTLEYGTVFSSNTIMDTEALREFDIYTQFDTHLLLISFEANVSYKRLSFDWCKFWLILKTQEMSRCCVVSGLPSQKARNDRMKEKKATLVDYNIKGVNLVLI